MRSIILCNGLAPTPGLLRQSLEWAEYFIAADGGANIALGLNLPPDVVVGDLDSYKPRGNESFEIIEDPGQETNDLEKALSLARKRNVAEIMILGGTGERLDHTLKNISVLKQFNPHFKDIHFRDDFGKTLLLPKSYSGNIPEGTSISLFPLSGSVTGITTTGLKYPLHDEKLENGVRDGSSNTVVTPPIKISYKKGDLLMFVAK